MNAAWRRCGVSEILAPDLNVITYLLTFISWKRHHVEADIQR